MNAREREAIATIGLLAAQADVRRHPEEDTLLKHAFETFGVTAVGSIRARVTLGTAVLEEEAATLVTPGLREAAWELARGVCAADGEVTTEEHAFLDRLREALQFPRDPAPLPIESEFPVIESVAATPGAPGAVADEAALDTMVRNAAVLTGALELLPSGLATLGILPLQLKLVADVAAAYGHRVDGSHAKELLAAAGIGLGGQAVEGMVRRLLGRIAGRFGGAAAGGVVDTAAGAATTFATTFALGQVARSWYASGRTLDRADLEARLVRAIEDGKSLFAHVRETVEAKARALSEEARGTVLPGG